MRYSHQLQACRQDWRSWGWCPCPLWPLGAPPAQWKGPRVGHRLSAGRSWTWWAPPRLLRPPGTGTWRHPPAAPGRCAVSSPLQYEQGETNISSSPPVAKAPCSDGIIRIRAGASETHGPWPGRDKNGIKLMRLWKLYKITDNPRLDFNKMRNFPTSLSWHKFSSWLNFQFSWCRRWRRVESGARLLGRKSKFVRC